MYSESDMLILIKINGLSLTVSLVGFNVKLLKPKLYAPNLLPRPAPLIYLAIRGLLIAGQKINYWYAYFRKKTYMMFGRKIRNNLFIYKTNLIFD